MIRLILLLAIVGCSSANGLKSHDLKDAHNNNSPQFEPAGQLR